MRSSATQVMLVIGGIILLAAAAFGVYYLINRQNKVGTSNEATILVDRTNKLPADQQKEVKDYLNDEFEEQAQPIPVSIFSK